MAITQLTSLIHNIHRIKWTLDYGLVLYIDLKETGVWEASLNKIPGSYGMIVNRTRPREKNSKCYNCDSVFHVARNFPEPKDPVKSKKNWDACTAAKLTNCCPLDPKWRPPEPGGNGKHAIDDVPYTYNIVTNQWGKDVTPPYGLLAPADTPPPQQPAWQPVAAPAPSPQTPSTSDTKVGGALLAKIHGTMGQKKSDTMGFPGQHLYHN